MTDARHTYNAKTEIYVSDCRWPACVGRHVFPTSKADTFYNVHGLKLWKTVKSKKSPRQRTIETIIRRQRTYSDDLENVDDHVTTRVNYGRVFTRRNCFETIRFFPLEYFSTFVSNSRSNRAIQRVRLLRQSVIITVDAKMYDVKDIRNLNERHYR